MSTLHEWKDAILQSYAASVPPAEFAAKSSDKSVTQIAYYFMNSGYEIELFDDTSADEPNSQVQFLFDFLAFTEGME